jgi:hypothetical protein
MLQPATPAGGRICSQVLPDRMPNMKELRFSAADGEWRVAFAFDTKRKADHRFDAHLPQLKKERM